jgi:hypothetical protein
MGWWRNTSGEIIGDDPADILDDALRSLASSAGKLSLSVAISAIDYILHVNPSVYADSGETPFRLLASSGGHPVPEHGPVDPHVIDVLTNALDAIANDYRISEMARLPTVEELAATLRFILGSEPERLVSGAIAPIGVLVDRSEGR